MIKARFISYVLMLGMFNTCTVSKKKATDDTQVYFKYTAKKRELRGVWVATVENIDWPSKKGLSSNVQKKEFAELAKSHKNIGMNALFVQVRAASDAFMSSRVEPWSEWLTGEQGKAPEPFYDPLEYMINETHNLGMEFHAWLNLNRGKHKTAKSLATDAVVKLHPNFFYDYDGYQIYDFGKPEVRDYITRVVVQIVKDYDVDGIHFDDYFYPYLVNGQKIPDEETFKQYGSGFPSIEDWRRDNINLLIEQISTSIKKAKPYVKFGVSPFGVWRNKKDDANGSETSGGASFDGQFADTKFWVQQGWVDYIAPQVYFSTYHPKVPYEKVAKWWTKHAYGRVLVMGMGAYKINNTTSDAAWGYHNQMPKQMRINRENPPFQGEIFYSSKVLRNNPLGFADSLKNNFYKYKALPPAYTWIDSRPPFPPSKFFGNSDGMGIKLWWEPPKMGEKPFYYAIYRFGPTEVIDTDHAENLINTVSGKSTDYLDLSVPKPGKYRYVITSLDRQNNESEASIVLEVSKEKGKK